MEVAHFFGLTLGEVCQILLIARRQGYSRGLYKWSEDDGGMVDDVTEKRKDTTLCFDGEFF